MIDLDALVRAIEARPDLLVRLRGSIAAVDEVSSVRLPPDARSVAAFNRACRSGCVEGARKQGRAWICSRDAWNRRRSRVPSIAKARPRTRAREEHDPAMLESLGLATSRGSR